MLEFYSIDYSVAGMDAFLLVFYTGLPAWEAALAFGEDYDSNRMAPFRSLWRQT